MCCCLRTSIVNHPCLPWLLPSSLEEDFLASGCPEASSLDLHHHTKADIVEKKMLTPGLSSAILPLWYWDRKSFPMTSKLTSSSRKATVFFPSCALKNRAVQLSGKEQASSCEGRGEPHDMELWEPAFCWFQFFLRAGCTLVLCPGDKPVPPS